MALLIVLAVWKAALVALHFMHLKFEKRTLAMIALSPFVLCVFLILMLMPDIFPGDFRLRASDLNAALNTLSAVFLLAGYLFIKLKNQQAHRRCMLAAFGCSMLFLISYLVYHYQVGSVPFKGQGWIRPVYFTILITHTILATTVVPLALITLIRAWREIFRAPAHRALDVSHMGLCFGHRRDRLRHALLACAVRLTAVPSTMKQRGREDEIHRYCRLRRYRQSIDSRGRRRKTFGARRRCDQPNGEQRAGVSFGI